LLVSVDLLARQWRQSFGAAPGERIGVLLPNTITTPVVLLSLWASEKVPTVLNYSTGAAIMLACAQLAGLKRIVTSRLFLERARLNVDPFVKTGIELIYLEDVGANIPGLQKFSTALRQWFRAPRFARQSRPDETAIILFTSGSEGVPKGVELTHCNLMANIRQLQLVIDFEDTDRVFTALPLFHSFGLVGTMLPLVRGIYVFIYLSPLHYRVVPTMVYDRDCTIMLSTNTFLNGYARKAHPYDFHTLRYMFAGAEKVQEATAELWARRFGVRILEGYGATECGPCVSLNTSMEGKYGSAGKLLPHIEYKLEPVEGVTEGGRLLVRGPNVMKGYLNPDANARFKALGSWYDTGDIVSVDAERFVTILGRLKRFAKVSGEMVSLTAVEDALAGAFPQYGLRCQVAVLSRPDADKGEMLVAVTNEPHLQLEEIRAAVKARGLPNLCAPRELKCVREIPKLGTGKVNHRELAKMLESDV
jgi:acyl-[acyl-carrier-protein]-phospholipid O-acyltransferase / long-chain-fatty-acid--[acyl-carrier-protein] ligase